MSPRARRLLYPPPSWITASLAIALTAALLTLACLPAV